MQLHFVNDLCVMDIIDIMDATYSFPIRPGCDLHFLDMTKFCVIDIIDATYSVLTHPGCEGWLHSVCNGVNLVMWLDV